MPVSYTHLDVYKRQTLRRAVESAEVETIGRALEHASYNKTEAAKLLGISVRTLYYKMQKYGFTQK